MHIIIAKVNEVLFDGEAESLTVPATSGEMTVLGGHMPLITTLKEGVVIIREGKGAAAREFNVNGGILEVRHDGVTVIL